MSVVDDDSVVIILFGIISWTIKLCCSNQRDPVRRNPNLKQMSVPSYLWSQWNRAPSMLVSSGQPLKLAELILCIPWPYSNFQHSTSCTAIACHSSTRTGSRLLEVCSIRGPVPDRDISLISKVAPSLIHNPPQRSDPSSIPFPY